MKGAFLLPVVCHPTSKDIGMSYIERVRGKRNGSRQEKSHRQLTAGGVTR
jgi:hypothetical protein